MHNPLSDEQRKTYRQAGHLTVHDLVSQSLIDSAIKDIEVWSREFLNGLNSEDQKRWYVEQAGGQVVLRKLDNPVFERDAFRRLASDPTLTSAVEQLIGPGLRVWFSQVFLKPSGGGGPKPIHQDNFYFGPSDSDGAITAWVALDDATIENGCLHFADGSNTGPVHPHEAPPNEPFNLQVPSKIASKYQMTPAPVPRGGVSFHHGNTLHQSSENNSNRPRRALAIHYLNRETVFQNPAFPYDSSRVVDLSE